jgi:hypothetical protein
MRSEGWVMALRMPHPTPHRTALLGHVYEREPSTSWVVAYGNIGTRTVGCRLSRPSLASSSFMYDMTG